MLAHAAFLIAMAAPGAQQPVAAKPATSAKEVVSNLFAHYYKLDSLAGSIKLTVYAGPLTQVTSTDIAYQQPSRFFLHQVRTGTDAREKYITSDGKRFSYDIPHNIIESNDNHRLIETCLRPGGGTISIDQIYAVGVDSIVDRSIPLGIAICWKEELERIKHQLATLVFDGSHDFKGTSAYIVHGDYRMDPVGPVVGTYQLVVGTDYSLLEFSFHMVYGAPDSNPNLPTADFKAVWDCNLKTNVQPDESLFKVRL